MRTMSDIFYIGSNIERTTVIKTKRCHAFFVTYSFPIIYSLDET